jgi:FkbM family methyltransferase
MKSLEPLKNYYKKIKYFLCGNSHINYHFGKYQIILNNNHVLAQYRKAFPLYDQFLPILCAEFDGLIIDIGANIGDTSIAIFSKNSNSFIVGVEPDSFFYSECINNIRANGLSDRFLGINKFISTKLGAFELKKSKNNSTASILFDSEKIAEFNSISFTHLMDLIPSEMKICFDILKIDTDGFDWDVLNSFIDYCKIFEFKPKFIFFEMQTYLNDAELVYSDRTQIIQNYNSSLKNLQLLGYNWFYLFDNFGTPLQVTQSLEQVFELNNYIYKSQIYNLRSTIYYLDVLAFSENDFELVSKSVNRLFNSILK